MIRGYLAVVIGHDQKAKGALAVEPLSCYEYDYNSEIAKLVAREATDMGVKAQVFDRNQGLKAAYENVNGWLRNRVGCSIELHFNASTNPAAMGCETLYIDRNHSDVLAGMVQMEVLKALYYLDSNNGRPEFRQKHNRRTKALAKSDRGYGNLSLLEGIAGVIAEPFFGSNLEDAKTALERKKEYAIALIMASRSFFALPHPPR